MEEWEDEIEKEHGIIIDLESADERALSHEVLAAELMYFKHSRKKELDLIHSMIV